MDFGAFVDIGVHEDGLVHISQMSDHGFVKSPLDVVSVGDIVDVKVIGVDLQRNRISLSMKLGEPAGRGKKPEQGKEKGPRESTKAAKNHGRRNEKEGRDRRGGGSAGKGSGGLDLSALLRKWN